MTIELNPSELPEAQTFTYISDYVQVVDRDPETNAISVRSISNVSNVTFSISQPNVRVNVGDNKIWFNGYYRHTETAQPTSIVYLEPPYGNDITDTPTVETNVSSVPPRKFLYAVNEQVPEGATVTHSLKVSYNGGGNGTFTIDRFVYPNIYTGYNFLLGYQWYTGE